MGHFLFFIRVAGGIESQPCRDLERMTFVLCGQLLAGWQGKTTKLWIPVHVPHIKSTTLKQYAGLSCQHIKPKPIGFWGGIPATVQTGQIFIEILVKFPLFFLLNLGVWSLWDMFLFGGVVRVNRGHSERNSWESLENVRYSTLFVRTHALPVNGGKWQRPCLPFLPWSVHLSSERLFPASSVIPFWRKISQKALFL